MENQYYAVVEKQDFFEIIENKFGELAVFIDARENEPLNPSLEYNGDGVAVLHRDDTRIIKLGKRRGDAAEVVELKLI